ncbi:hypothetical protein SO802_016100 [Lithocarpus litseifolius]|uniref:Uncharacterized protein n=1 Tax=Lithocarpus litseifolius TaxID=425828 RepID=A0AAW2CY06_9ROSI
MGNGENMLFFRIDTKAFSLAFDGGRMDSYSIFEKRGRYHGSIRVGRSGLDWIIACLVELGCWDFSKQHFFKRFHENYKILECSSRLNKGGFFVEISEYHNGARRGCLRVPEGFHKGGWAFLERKLRDFFLGKPASRPGKEVAAGGGRFVKPTGNPTHQVWKEINGHVKLESDLDLEKQFPKLAGTSYQEEGLGGFDFLPKTNISTHHVSGRPMRASSFKWTKAHFSLNISVDLEGKGQRVVKWANFVQPKNVKDVITPTVLGPAKQAQGGPIEQAQDDLLAKTKQNQTGDSTHLKSQGLSRSCERDEGPGSHVCAEKSTLGTGEMGGDFSTSDGDSYMAVQEVFVPMGCTGEMGGDLSTSVGGSDMAVQEGFALMGCTGSGAEVGVPSTISVADDLVTNCLISGDVEVPCVSNSNGHPSFNDSVVGCSTSTVKRAEMFCHQTLLERNRFSPISELGSDSFEEETLLLDWVNPTGSDKDKEDCQLTEYVPLAQWDPNGGLVLMTEEDDPVDISEENDLEPSAWIAAKAVRFLRQGEDDSAIKWATQDTSSKMPYMGLNLTTKMAQTGLGCTQMTVANFSNPSSFEMGESSAKASPTPLNLLAPTAEALSDKPMSPMALEMVADRQAEPPVVVLRRSLAETSSDSLSVGRTDADCRSDGLVGPQLPLIVAGNCGACLGIVPMEFGCTSSAGCSSEGHTVTQMVLGSAGVCSDDPVLPLGKADGVDTPTPRGSFLAAALHSKLDVGLLDFGDCGVDKAGGGNIVHLIKGVNDKCTRQIDVPETEQPNLALIESKLVCGSSDLGVVLEEGGAISDVAFMGEEENVSDYLLAVDGGIFSLWVCLGFEVCGVDGRSLRFEGGVPTATMIRWWAWDVWFVAFGGSWDVWVWVWVLVSRGGRGFRCGGNGLFGLLCCATERCSGC